MPTNANDEKYDTNVSRYHIFLLSDPTLTYEITKKLANRPNITLSNTLFNNFNHQTLSSVFKCDINSSTPIINVTAHGNIEKNNRHYIIDDKNKGMDTGDFIQSIQSHIPNNKPIIMLLYLCYGAKAVEKNIQHLSKGSILIGFAQHTAKNDIFNDLTFRINTNLLSNHGDNDFITNLLNHILLYTPQEMTIAIRGTKENFIYKFEMPDELLIELDSIKQYHNNHRISFIREYNKFLSFENNLGLKQINESTKFGDFNDVSLEQWQQNYVRYIIGIERYCKACTDYIANSNSLPKFLAFTLNSGENLLHFAAYDNQIELVKLLVSKKLFDVDSTNREKFAPLDMALISKYNKTFKYLLLYAKDIDAIRPNGHSLLHMAMAHDLADKIKILCEAGAKLNVTLKESTNISKNVLQDTEQQVIEEMKAASVFLTAILQSRKRAAVALIECGVPLYNDILTIRTNDSSIDILDWAIEKSSTLAITRLLSTGFYNLQNIRTERYKNLLDLASKDETFAKLLSVHKVDLVELAIIQQDANTALKFIDSSTDFKKHGTNLLKLGMAHRNINLVQAALEKKVDTNIHNNNNDRYTPLHYAVANGDAELTRLLLAKDAKMTAAGNGLRPLHLAAFFGHHNILQILLQHFKEDLKLNYKDANGFTPLHYAAYNNDHKVIKLLLDNGANYNLHTKANVLTPLELAKAKGNKNATVMLSDHKFTKDTWPQIYALAAETCLAALVVIGALYTTGAIKLALAVFYLICVLPTTIATAYKVYSIYSQYQADINQTSVGLTPQLEQVNIRLPDPSTFIQNPDATRTTPNSREVKTRS
jgi:ankyrin repeat protein